MIRRASAVDISKLSASRHHLSAIRWRALHPPQRPEWGGQLPQSRKAAKCHGQGDWS